MQMGRLGVPEDRWSASHRVDLGLRLSPEWPSQTRAVFGLFWVELVVAVAFPNCWLVCKLIPNPQGEEPFRHVLGSRGRAWALSVSLMKLAGGLAFSCVRPQGL